MIHPDGRVRHADGFVHISDLKWMAKSPYHYRYACEGPRKEASDEMRVGALFDSMVFPGHRRPYVVYEGRRYGKKWDAFEDLHANDDIYTVSEYERAKGAADELLKGPTGEAARPYLIGQHQLVMQWEAFGVQFASGIEGERGGIDVLGDDHAFIADTKLTNCTEPLQFARHARKQLWPQQLVCYAEALVKKPRELVLIGVESTPPHVVTVLTLTPAMIDRAYQSLVLWTEKLRACDASGRWPGYSDAVCECDVDPWEREDDDDA